MFKKLSEDLLKKTYIFSLGVILLLIVLNIFFIFFLKVHQANTQKEQELYKQTLGRKNAILVNLNSLDMSIRGYLLTENPAFKETYHKMYDVQLKDFEILDSLLSVIDYNPKGYASIKEVVEGYYKDMGSVIEMKINGQEAEAIEVINQDKGTAIWQQYVDFSVEYDKYLKSADMEIMAAKETLIFINLTLEILLGVFGIPILFFIIYLIISTNNREKALLEDLKKQNNTLLFYEADTEDVTLNTEKILGKLMSNIEKASQFVENLAIGKYNTEWDGTTKNDDNNKHTLAGRLIKLKEKLAQVERERQQRKWFNEGINNLSDIVRKHQDDKEHFYDQVLMFTLKYIGANQGGLFVFNNESKSLILKACYAFDRKKFTEKEIKIGEGIIGQAYLEKEAVHLRNIPSEYAYIQSGLGESAPASIYVLPLLNNEEVIGIIELASFTHFEEKEVSFLEKLGEIIASSLYVQLNNETTKELLERSQEQAEELRAQEEEMRQNTEELQATQEEMSRHKISLEKEIRILKEELQQKNSLIS